MTSGILQCKVINMSRYMRIYQKKKKHLQNISCILYTGLIYLHSDKNSLWYQHSYLQMKLQFENMSKTLWDSRKVKMNKLPKLIIIGIVWVLFHSSLYGAGVCKKTESVLYCF